MKNLAKIRSERIEKLVGGITPTNVHPDSQKILQKFNLTMAELKEYAILKKHLFGAGLFKSLFVVLDENAKETKRYNELSGKVIRLNAFLLSNRNNHAAGVITDALIQ